MGAFAGAKELNLLLSNDVLDNIQLDEPISFYPARATVEEKKESRHPKSENSMLPKFSPTYPRIFQSSTGSSTTRDIRLRHSEILPRCLPFQDEPAGSSPFAFEDSNRLVPSSMTRSEVTESQRTETFKMRSRLADELATLKSNVMDSSAKAVQRLQNPRTKVSSVLPIDANRKHSAAVDQPLHSIPTDHMDRDAPTTTNHGYTSSIASVVFSIPRNNTVHSESSLEQPFSTMETIRDSFEGYTLGDHAEYLHLRKEHGVVYVCDVGTLLVHSRIPYLVKEYPSPIPNNQLTALFSGLDPVFSKQAQAQALGHGEMHANANNYNKNSNNNNKNHNTRNNHPPEILPVRTLAFRIRPDIKTSVILDAIQKAVDDTQEPFVRRKRENGHFQCVVAHPEAPYILDAQLCTAMTSALERQLLVRIYHVNEDQQAALEVLRMQSSPKMYTHHVGYADDVEIQPSAIHLDTVTKLQGGSSMHDLNLCLKETSSLLQWIHTIAKSHDRINPLDTPSPRKTIKETSSYLLSNFHSAPSVQQYSSTKNDEPCFPSLSTEDASILQSSWPLLLNIWMGLVSSNAAFHSLDDLPLAHPLVMDSLYLYQIRQLARDPGRDEHERMAEQWEQHASRAELAHENFLALIEPVWKHYQLSELQPLPTPRLAGLYTFSAATNMSLEDDATLALALMASNQVICSHSAQATATTYTTPPESIVDEMARNVFAALREQDEKDQQRYLKEKNTEIMKRLVEIQSRQRELLAELDDPENLQLRQAAKEFSSLARQAKNVKGRMDRVIPTKVPLLELQTTRLACYITPIRMLMVGKGMFAQTNVFDLKAVEFHVVQILQTNYLHVIDKEGEVIYKYRPPIDAQNLKVFLDTLKALLE